MSNIRDGVTIEIGGIFSENRAEWLAVLPNFNSQALVDPATEAPLASPRDVMTAMNAAARAGRPFALFTHCTAGVQNFANAVEKMEELEIAFGWIESRLQAKGITYRRTTILQELGEARVRTFDGITSCFFRRSLADNQVLVPARYIDRAIESGDPMRSLQSLATHLDAARQGPGAIVMPHLPKEDPLRIVGTVVRMYVDRGSQASTVEAEYDRNDFDATEGVLSLSLDEIHALEDRRDCTDALRPEGEPYAPLVGSMGGGTDVIVCDNVLAFFQVEALEEITQEMLDEARAARLMASAPPPP